MQTSKSMVLRGGDVHNSPLYTLAQSRESKGLTAMIILCSLAVQAGVRTYLHCICPDIGTCSRSKSMVAQNRESKQPSVIVILGSLVVFTCGFWCSRADIRHVGLDVYLHC